MNQETESGTPAVRITEFGPYRTIGVSCIGAGAEDFGGVWDGEAGFGARRQEVAPPPGAGLPLC